MIKGKPVGAPVPETEPVEDLELRLRRLRLRMEAEGRKSAVSLLDKAIARAGKRRARNASNE